MSLASPAAKASGVASVRKPFFPSRMSVFTEGQSLRPTAGKPIAKPSAKARLKPSKDDGKANIDALRSLLGTSSVTPLSKNRPSNPSLAINSSILAVRARLTVVSPHHSHIQSGN